MEKNLATYIDAAKSLHLSKDLSKGRYVTAKKSFARGEIMISEQAFAAVLTSVQRNGVLNCHHCFKEVVGNGHQCCGCQTMYCCKECKRVAWKCHHWLECGMSSLLNKTGLEARMALRILLKAASSMFQHNDIQCSPLHHMTCTFESETGDIKAYLNDGCTVVDKARRYVGDYWSVFCLQTHQAQSQVAENSVTIFNDIHRLADVLVSCLSFQDKLSKHVDIKCRHLNEEEHSQLHGLLHSVFQNLSFTSYYIHPKFDIESWRSCVTASSERSLCYREGRSLAEILSDNPASRQQIIERLLLHHALQIRTNAQAVFKVCASEARNMVVDEVQQIRIATAIFPATSLMNHSCSPNTSLTFNGRNIQVVASKAIPVSEEVLHCYGPSCSRHGYEERQRLLMDQYFFKCDCESCQQDISESEDLDSYKLQFHAFRCSTCGDPIKQERDDKSLGTCVNTKCRMKCNLTKKLELFQKSKEIFDEACRLQDMGDIGEAGKRFKKCLAMREPILYHNHTEIGKVHDQIAKCFVMQENYSSAIQHLSKSIKIVGMMHGPKSFEITLELQKLASCYFNSGESAKAAATARKVVMIYKVYNSDRASWPIHMQDMYNIIDICS